MLYHGRDSTLEKIIWIGHDLDNAKKLNFLGRPKGRLIWEPKVNKLQRKMNRRQSRLDREDQRIAWWESYLGEPSTVPRLKKG